MESRCRRDCGAADVNLQWISYRFSALLTGNAERVGWVPKGDIHSPAVALEEAQSHVQGSQMPIV